MTVKLDEVGDGFVLRHSDGSTMNISAAELLGLAPFATLLRDQLLQAQRAGTMRAVTPLPAVEITLSPNALESAVLLGLVTTPGGAAHSYLVPLDVAQRLAERLPVLLAELSQPGRHPTAN